MPTALELSPAVSESPQAESERAQENLFSSPGKRTVVLSLLLFLLTLALYNSVVHNGFINLDDNLYVTNNPNVTAGLHWTSFKWALTTFEQANWHPLTWLSHALDWQLFQKNAGGHHYMSLLLHAADAVLLFLLLQSATRFTWRSLMVAALFAVHPANVESVAWVAERKNVLSMLFFLLAMLAYGWYARQPSLRRYSLVPFLFALGLMAKPQVITLPFVLLLWDYWPLQRFGSAADRAAPPQFAPASFGWLVLEKVPLLLLSAADAVITMHAQRVGLAVRSITDYSLYGRLGNAVISYARYVGHTFWPFYLSPSYSHPGDAILLWQVVASCLFLLVVTGLVLLSRKRYMLVGWLWFLGTLVPMIGIVQVGDQAMADRYAYIPFIGLFWMATWGITEAASRWHVSPRWLAVPACLFVLTAAMLSHQLIGYWHDSEALWDHALTVNNHDFMAHTNRGRILVVENRPEEAIAEFETAEALHNYPVSEVLRFAGYELRHRHSEDAAARCRKVLQTTQDPHLRAVAWTDMGVANMTLNHPSQAQENFQKALETDPHNPGAIIGMGLVAERSGDFSRAADLFSRAVSYEPNDLGYFLLATALENGGRQAEASAAFAQAQRISPNMNEVVERAHELLP
jgi:tetratricopeptide (TPR) repeat protein